MQLDGSRTGTSRSAAGRGRPGSHSHAQEIPPAAARSTLGRAGSTGPPPPAGRPGRANQRTNVPRRQGKASQCRGARARSGLVAEATWGCRGQAGESFAPSCSCSGGWLPTARTARTPAHVTLRAARCLAPLPASAPRPRDPNPTCVRAGRPRSSQLD
jgi:hypothetical protein